MALALLTAFGLANAAAVNGLSTAMAPWAAALVLAGVWVGVAGLVTLALRLRAERGEGWAWWRMLAGGAPEGRESLEAERARAEAEVRAALERAAPALGAAAASAAVPIASAVAAGMAAEVAAGALETGSDLIEASDESSSRSRARCPAAASSTRSRTWCSRLGAGASRSSRPSSSALRRRSERQPPEAVGRGGGSGCRRDAWR